MIPSQLYALSLIRDKILKDKEIRDDDKLKQATFSQYLEKMFYLENPSKLEKDLRQILPNYTEFIDYELFTNHMEKLQNSN